ncbi:MAG: radical SAM protein [Peptococcaceae bacterium]
MYYDMPLYRPPSEADSLILQITLGCSHNKCTFCSMYKTKKFRILSDEEITGHLAEAKEYYPLARRIFLADGNALTMDTTRLLELIKVLKPAFPKLERITAYAGPRDILQKTAAELKALHAGGLEMLYLGVESGSAKILEEINKGVSPAEMISAGQKARRAGFKLSCTIILGLGGKENWKEHACRTAEVINAIQPEYLGALTLMIEERTPLYHKVQNQQFQLLKPLEVIEELTELIHNLELEDTVFRSNHASNYLALKGTLNKDKHKLLQQLEEAGTAGQSRFRPEGWRGL